jgi:hypothetical protein
MECFECRKLKLECARTALDHRELLRLRGTGALSPPQDDHEIWDFIMDMAVKKQGDAERALARHRERHTSVLTPSASILTAVLGQSHLFEATQALCGL